MLFNTTLTLAKKLFNYNYIILSATKRGLLRTERHNPSPKVQVVSEHTEFNKTTETQS